MSRSPGRLEGFAMVTVRPRRRLAAAAVLAAVVVLVDRDPRRHASVVERPVVPRRGASTPSGQSRGAGTRPCSTPSGARCRTRPSTRATSSTRRSRCGTPGPPTTPTRVGLRREREGARRRTSRRPGTRRSATPPTGCCSARYIKAVGGDQSLSEFDDVMDSLCYPLDVTTTEGDTPGRGRQPDRRRGARLRQDRRLERGRRLQLTRLQDRSTRRSWSPRRARRWRIRTAGSRSRSST